ncbi:MAG: hypothetical protein FWD46_04975 [Cystobacterineae bacterium]|nr:hypothetical protein [Cystobacterineae bacterium]
MNTLSHTLLASLWAMSPEAPLSMGRVEGGWGYIWFSYALVWLALLAYAFYLLRLRSQLQEGAEGPSKNGPLLPQPPPSTPSSREGLAPSRGETAPSPPPPPGGAQ